MHCELGVHTDEVEIIFTPEVWAGLRAAMPTRTGRGGWAAVERDGGVHFARTHTFGCVPKPLAKKPGLLRMTCPCDTVVRRHTSPATIRVVANGRFAVDLPPHHEWQWIVDPGTRSKSPPHERRLKLVQELNARVASARKAGLDELPPDLPQWVSRMLTGPEWVRVHNLEEIA